MINKKYVERLINYFKFDEKVFSKLIVILITLLVSSSLNYESQNIVAKGPPENPGNDDSGSGSNEENGCDADYPNSNGSCIIQDNYTVEPDENFITFHYEGNSLNLGGGASRKIYTDEVCLVTTGAGDEQIFAQSCDKVPEDEGNTFQNFNSRVYFYLTGQNMLTLSGNADITNTSGRPGRFRIYGNPDDPEEPGNPQEGDPPQEIIFNGTPCFEGFIYALTATAGINGGGTGCGVTGAIWVNEWSASDSNAPGALVNVPANTDQAFEDIAISESGLRVYRSSSPQQWQRQPVEEQKK